MDDDNSTSASNNNGNVAQDTQKARSRARLAHTPASDDTSVEGADDDDDSDYVDHDSEGEDGDNAKKPRAQSRAACDSDEEEVIEMKVKSQDTVIRENFNRALATGNVYTIPSTTLAAGARRSTSLRSTFSSISSSVTAMRNGGAKLAERRVTLKDQSAMIAYKATRMVLDKASDGFKIAPGETSNGRKILVSLNPFAQGGIRNVYRMKQKHEACQVAKESRHDINYHERLKFHVEGCKCQARATVYAKAFNNRIKKCKKQKRAGQWNSRLDELSPINVLHAEVYRLKDTASPGGFRYLAVEREMKKGEYQKWNSNNGYVNPKKCQHNDVSQAFSHFSYEHSQEKEMVVDVQGSGYTFTDPQLHSKEKGYGRADRGNSGFKDFFKSHQCNWICCEIGLTNRSTHNSSVSGTSVAAATASTASSSLPAGSRQGVVKQENEQNEATNTTSTTGTIPANWRSMDPFEDFNNDPVDLEDFY